MARPRDDARREHLLDGTLEYLRQHGLDGLSLRPLAAHLGTSSRMLIHHFGTREALLAQALARYRQHLLPGAAPGGGGDVAVAAWNVWLDITAPAAQGQLRLLFQVLAHAEAVSGGPVATVARQAVEDWIEAVSRTLAAAGRPPDDCAPLATVLVSGLRGLALDLLVTGDRPRCDRAARLLIAAAVGPPRQRGT
jgi:AcrR family transcriptional regulator